MTAPVFPAGEALQRKLIAVAAFLPIFEAPGFVFGTWKEPTSNGGIAEMPHVNLSEEASSFQRTVYESHFIIPFDWGEWIGTEEARILRDSPDALSSATAEQLAKLLTVFIRQDRFVEGALLEAFDTGILVAVLRRAAVLSS